MRPPLRAAAALLAALSPCCSALAGGARHDSSGALDLSADGRTLWLANELGDEVAVLDTWTEETRQYLLQTGCRPTSVSVTADGGEAWLSCFGDDRLAVLDRRGVVLASIELGFGSAPVAVALSPDDQRVLALTRFGRQALLLDRAARTVLDRVDLPQQPLALSWREDGERAWASAARTDGEGSRVFELEVDAEELRLVASRRLVPPEVRFGTALRDRGGVPEGGTPLLAAPPVPRPGSDEVWLAASQLNAGHAAATPQASVNAALYALTPSEGIDVAGRRVLTARDVHSLTPTPVRIGDGWDADLSGPVDLGFESDGETAWVLFEHSETLARVPADLPAIRPDGAEALTLVPVGRRPRALVLSPDARVAWVYGELSQTLSLVDLAGGTVWRELPIASRPDAGRDPGWLAGAGMFFTSSDPRTSARARVACASCHWNGEDDGLTWAFQFGNGTGPRATQSLAGLARCEQSPDPVSGLGQFHRAGDVDRVVDFTCAFNGARQGGEGFVQAPPQYYGDPRCPGDPIPQAAFDLAGFLLSVPAWERSPHRPGPGAVLDEAALRGWRTFLSPHAAGWRCTACHDATRFLQDGGHHDVGGFRSPFEQQLTEQGWRANTPTLVGLFATPPHDDGGRHGPAFAHVRDLLDAFSGDRPGHGRVADLTGRQRDDLAAFLLSLDGDLAGSDFATLDDESPPRALRVEPLSETRLVVFFSETVEPTSAESLANWRLLDAAGEELPVRSAVRQEPGDRVLLEVELRRDCSPAHFTLLPGPIRDATPASERSALDAGDSRNRLDFEIGDTLTVSFGASGRESFVVPVHDAGIQDPRESLALDAMRLGPGPEAEGPPLRGFLRFEWAAALAGASDAQADDFVAASLRLHPRDGLAQPVALRRVLRAWSEPPTPGDGDPISIEGPLWRRPVPGGDDWALPGAGLLRSADDPAGPGDLSPALDAVAAPVSLDEALVFEGPALVAALRAGFEEPPADHGWALEPAEERAEPLSFRSAEEHAGRWSPVLTLTYRLPSVPAPLPELSGPDSGTPLLVGRDGTGLGLSLEDTGGAAVDVIEGAIGHFRDGSVAACAEEPAPAGAGRARMRHEPGDGSRWLLVAASGPCGGDPGGGRPALASPCAP